jgi:hypothetical protein
MANHDRWTFRMRPYHEAPEVWNDLRNADPAASLYHGGQWFSVVSRAFGLQLVLATIERVTGLVLVRYHDQLHYKWGARLLSAPTGAQHLLVREIVDKYIGKMKVWTWAVLTSATRDFANSKGKSAELPRPCRTRFTQKLRAMSVRKHSTELARRFPIYGNVCRPVSLMVWAACFIHI